MEKENSITETTLFGKCKFFNSAKGYGFITSNDGQDYFFHFSGLPKKEDKVGKDDKVSFELEEGNKGLKAINIKPI